MINKAWIFDAEETQNESATTRASTCNFPASSTYVYLPPPVPTTGKYGSPARNCSWLQDMRPLSAYTQHQDWQ